MKVTLEQLPERQVVLDIEADPEELEASRKKAYRKLVGRVRIPGFRKGKAPLPMLERWVGKEALLEEALNFLIPDATSKAIEEQDVEAAGAPSIEVSGLDPVAWKATIPLVPTVDLGDYRALRIEPEPVAVDDDEVERAIEDIRFNEAPWEPVERAVEMGDLVTLDAVIEEAGQTIADQEDAQFRPTEGEPRPIPGFSEALVGIEPGAEKQFTLEFEESDERKEFSGRSFAFTVTVKEIKAKDLPEIDDEFAKGVEDGFEDLAALRAHVRGRLEERAAAAAKDRLRERALDRLIEAATVAFPPTLVDHEAEHLLEQQASQAGQDAAGVDAYVQALGKEKEELIEEMKPAARARIVRSLVASELRTAEEIEVEPEEIDAEVETLVGSAGAGYQEEFRRIFGTDESRQRMEQSILTRKTLDRLAEIMTQEETEAAAEDAAEEKEPTP